MLSQSSMTHVNKLQSFEQEALVHQNALYRVALRDSRNNARRLERRLARAAEAAAPEAPEAPETPEGPETPETPEAESPRVEGADRRD